jgi:hypothetical protein
VNKDDIMRMARKAGGDDWGIFQDFMPEIERFATLVAETEREECAKMCEEISDEEYYLGRQYADMLRARGDK